ncbi:MAG: RNA 2'-phosphotransferase [Phascolarctobacterium sp.]
MEKTLIEWSRLLAMVLRHKPQVVGIELDAHGWAEVRAIVMALAKWECSLWQRSKKLLEMTKNSVIRLMRMGLRLGLIKVIQFR